MGADTPPPPRDPMAFNGDEPIPLGAPSIRYYPFIVTNLGYQIHLAVCANHYEAERMLNLYGSNPDYAGLYINMAHVAGPE
jgi:hypothetical protein